MDLIDHMIQFLSPVVRVRQATRYTVPVESSISYFLSVCLTFISSPPVDVCALHASFLWPRARGEGVKFPGCRIDKWSLGARR